MGYYMTMRNSNFFIAKTQKDKALAAIKKLAKGTNENGSGCDFFRKKTSCNAKNLVEALKEWRWETEENDEGNIEGVEFTGEKLGDDEILFNAIAPYVKKGSYIEMQGEEGGLAMGI